MGNETDLCIILAPSVARRTAEEKLKKLEGEQGGLERKVREATDASNSIADDLKLMTNQRDQLSQEKRNLEVSGQAAAFVGMGIVLPCYSLPSSFSSLFSFPSSPSGSLHSLSLLPFHVFPLLPFPHSSLLNSPSFPSPSFFPLPLPRSSLLIPFSPPALSFSHSLPSSLPVLSTPSPHPNSHTASPSTTTWPRPRRS